MVIFPHPKKIIYTGELEKIPTQFKILRNDFESEIDYGLSKLEICNCGAELSVICDSNYKKEQYKLVLTNEGVKLTASTPRGAWNALITLRQVISNTDVCCVEIEDEPDFENRGYLFSIRRSLKMSELKKFIDYIADLKINQIQFISDRTVFEALELNNNGDEIFSVDDMHELDEYCRLNKIELIPEVNSFGHMHDWLALDKYRELAIAPEGFYRTDEYNKTSLCNPGTLDPYNPKSFELIDKIYTWLFRAFSTDNVNVGCDETFDLGEGKCKELAESIGKNKIYTDHMQKINEVCKKHNKKMMFWADMIIDDVEALKRMPRDAVALTWGYEEEHPFDIQCRNLRESGLSYYVSPGTSAWGSVVGRSTNMMLNQLSAAENGKKYGAAGYLLTEWGDCGAIQTPVITYLPIAYGAGVSWSVENNREINGACDYLDKNIFNEKGFAEFLFNCGEAYKLEAYKRFNHAVVVTALYTNLDDNVYMYDQTPEHFEKIINYASSQIAELDRFKSCPKKYIEEIKLNLKMLIVLAKVCIVKLNGTVSKEALVSELQEVAEEHEQIWLRTARRSGVEIFVNYTNKIIHSLKEV